MTRFRENEARMANAAELRKELSFRLLDKPALEWEHIFSAVHVPAAKVRTAPEVLATPHIAQRGTIVQVVYERSRVAIDVPSIGFRWNRAPVGPVSGPPRLGEHTSQILGE